MVTPSTCCGKSGEGCVCATQAKCSCGEKSALHCTCGKAESENSVKGPRCSCRARPAGECTCDRATTENSTPAGSLCSCGARPADACTCEKAADGGINPNENEIDFTTKA
ncbi:related to Cu-binding metallothionein [Phialocephala subalpina]|uniref:Related to Cu-binding metallothionein n=1 Tax=Phialocephala subalpina TaxID=576137 RepID=A0A1L7X7N5_9HELO|nr:related to Cu-binding metallothionein [Phialocephala subalpina]